MAGTCFFILIEMLKMGYKMLMKHRQIVFRYFPPFVFQLHITMEAC
jgi:hypothetical protein